MRSVDICIESVQFSTTEHHYRAPIKFAGVAVDRATILTVNIGVRSPSGKVVNGWGSMPLGNVWAFPSSVLTYQETLNALLSCVAQVAKAWEDLTDWGHPVQLGWIIDKQLQKIAQMVKAQNRFQEPVPVLAAMVANSAFDAAVHDAYGRLHGKSSWKCYGPSHLRGDLSSFLGDEFASEHLWHHLMEEPVPALPLYHLVGALDSLGASDLPSSCGDCWPDTLEDWIAFNGLTHLKIKLSGEDIAWDVHRVLAVERVASASMSSTTNRHWHYSLDFNEKCPSVESLIEFLRRLDELSPSAFSRIAYIEQPTRRDLRNDVGNSMHQVSKQIPVVIDESLVDLESLYLAREMGYNGAALKACKGQTQSLLMAAAARKWGMFLCVQDLTCPGMSLVQSAGLASHILGVSALEANARQYLPEANILWANMHPGLFRITDGMIRTESLHGVGLCTQPPLA